VNETYITKFKENDALSTAFALVEQYLPENILHSKEDSKILMEVIQ
jgi:hypothetical protein